MNIGTHILIFLILILAAQNTSAQSQSNIDSLRKVIKISTGIKKVSAYHELSLLYLYNDSKKTLAIADELAEYSKKNNDSLGDAMSDYIRALNYDISNDSKKALSYYTKALEKFKLINRNEYEAILLIDLGILYKNTTQYDKAIEAYMKALSFYKSQNDSIKIAQVYYNTAIAFKSFSAFEKAKTLLFQALSYVPLIDNEFGRASIHNGLGLCYKELNKFDSAIYHLEITKKTFTDLGHLNEILPTYSALADIYFLIGKKEQAKILIDNSYYLLDSTAIEVYKINYLNCAANIAIEFNELDKAKKILDDLQLKLDTSNYWIQKQAVYKNYATLYYKLNDKDLAYQYLLKVQDLNESIVKDNLEKKALELEILHSVEEKNNQIKILTQKNYITELEIKDAASQRNIILLIASLLAIIALFAFWKYRFKQKQNQVLSELNKQLEQVNSTKDKLFSIIAHDLKNPVSAILMNTELLTNYYDDFEDKDRLKHLNMLKSSSQNMYETLMNLMLWSQIQRDKLEFSFDNLQIAQTIENNIELFSEALKMKNIAITNNISQQIYIKYDSQSLNILIKNLLSNAIKYSYKDSKIEINLINSENRIEIQVRDFGIGIEDSILKSLFTNSKNYSKTGTMNETGSGLGLIICNALALKNGSQLKLESVNGEGTIASLIINKN